MAPKIPEATRPHAIDTKSVLSALAGLDEIRDADPKGKVIVSYSDGKESRTCMDLAVRSFGVDRVLAFNMQFIPGMPLLEAKLRTAEARWKLPTPIMRVMHWGTADEIRRSTYCIPSPELLDRLAPITGLGDIYRIVRAKLGNWPIVMGGKAGDGVWRRWMKSKRVFSWEHNRIHYPLWNWTSTSVKAYLVSRGIGVPASAKDDGSGFDLHWRSLLWLHDNHPEDFAMMARVFPFIVSVPARRTFYPKAYEPRPA